MFRKLKLIATGLFAAAALAVPMLLHPGASESSVFNPLTITGATLWLDASDSRSVHRSAQGFTWNDKSGNGNNLSGVGNVPTLISRGGGKLPVVSFNNTNLYTATASPSSYSGLTVFIVHAQTGAETGSLLSLAGPNATSAASGLELTGSNSSSVGTRTVNIAGGSDSTALGGSPPSLPFGSYFVEEVTASPTQVTEYINGAQESQSTTANVGTSVFASRMALGSTLTTSGYGTPNISENIAEVIVYNRVLTANERETNEGYLAWKWGIQSALPTSQPYKTQAPDGVAVSVSGITCGPSTFRLTDANGNQLICNPTTVAFASAAPTSSATATATSTASGGGVSYAAYDAAPTPVTTPNVASGAYFVGGMYEGICKPKDQTAVANGTATWMPTEDICIKAASGAGQGTMSLVGGDTGTKLAGYNGRDGGTHNGTNGDVQAISLQGIVSGTAYQVRAVNNDAGGYGTVTFTVNYPSSATILAAAATPAPRTHNWYMGCMGRAGTQPFGIQNSDGTISEYKSRDIIDSGCQMARWNPEINIDDQSHNGGSITYTADDTSLQWLIAHNVVPYIEISAGTVNVTGHGQEYIEPNPGFYGTYVAGLMSHIKTSESQLGTTMPLLVSCSPANEPNTLNGDGSYGFNASQSDSPSLYSEAVGGEAPYIRACYAAVKAAFPGSQSTVYTGEFTNGTPGDPNSPMAALTNLYTNPTYSCRSSAWTGTVDSTHGPCWDAISFHGGSVGVPDEPFASAFYNNDGFTPEMMTEIQDAAVAQGDVRPRMMMSEVLIPYQNTNGFALNVATSGTYGAGNLDGQAYWVSHLGNYANQNPYIDGVVYASLDEDGNYCPPTTSTAFCGDSLVDTLTNPPYNWHRPGFDNFCEWAKNVPSCTYSANPDASPAPTAAPSATPSPTPTAAPTVATLEQTPACGSQWPATLQRGPATGDTITALQSWAFGGGGNTLADSNNVNVPQLTGSPWGPNPTQEIYGYTVIGTPTAFYTGNNNGANCVYDLAGVGTPTAYGNTTSSSGTTQTLTFPAQASDFVAVNAYSSNTETVTISQMTATTDNSNTFGSSIYHGIVSTSGTVTVTVTTTAGSVVNISAVVYPSLSDAPTGGNVSFVQSYCNTAAGTTIALPSPPTAGHIVAFTGGNGSTVVTNPTGSSGNGTYALRESPAGPGTSYTFLWDGLSPVGESGTYTMGASAWYCVYEIAGATTYPGAYTNSTSSSGLTDVATFASVASGEGLLSAGWGNGAAGSSLVINNGTNVVDAKVVDTWFASHAVSTASGSATATLSTPTGGLQSAMVFAAYH